jgi:hypothetical protein
MRSVRWDLLFVCVRVCDSMPCMYVSQGIIVCHESAHDVLVTFTFSQLIRHSQTVACILMQVDQHYYIFVE